MKIWVDADACPAPIKEILFRAANRLKIHTHLVANHGMKLPPSAFIHFVLVSKGFDIADHYILQQISTGDLVVTADIPLASEVIKQQCQALNPRGTLYTTENIADKLAMRDLREELRDLGDISGGPSAFGNKHKQAFANALDRILTKVKPQ